MAIRSKFKLKIQSEAHQKNVKTKKKITMKKKRDLAIRNEKKREPKVYSIYNLIQQKQIMLLKFFIFHILRCRAKRRILKMMHHFQN